MLYPTVPTPNRPLFWTLRIDSEFVRSLCPDVSGAFKAGRIGIDEAHRRLLVRLRERVARVLLRYPSLDTDDVTQDLIVRVAARGLADKFDPSRGIGAWPYLHAVIRNIGREMLRAPDPLLTSADEVPAESKPSSARGPLDAAAEADLLREVRDRYLNLSRRHRDALLVLYPFLEPGRMPERHGNEHVSRSRALSFLRSDLRDGGGTTPPA